MTGRELARLELDGILDDPSVKEQWPFGLTTDDVLTALHAIGRAHLRIHEGMPDGEGRPTVRYTCAVELREGSAGIAIGRGRSLTAAALRCLVDAEAELSDEVRRGLQAFSDLLDEA